jgi:hypothetical protein
MMDSRGCGVLDAPAFAGHDEAGKSASPTAMTTHPPNRNEAVLDIRKIESDIRERTLTPAPARPTAIGGC